MRVPLAVVAALLLAACADDAPRAPVPPATAVGIAVDSLVRDEPDRAYRVAIGYPQIADRADGPLDAPLRAVNAAVADTVAALADRLRPEAPPPGRAPMTAVTVTGRTERTFLADAVFSALVTVEAEAGGAPTPFPLALTYDLATGAPVAPADLFADGTSWADTLAAHVERSVGRALAARGGPGLFAPGLAPLRAGRLDLTLGPETVVVHVPAGQLTADDRAGFAVEVPIGAVAAFARPGSALARHPAL